GAGVWKFRRFAICHACGIRHFAEQGHYACELERCEMTQSHPQLNTAAGKESLCIRVIRTHFQSSIGKREISLRNSHPGDDFHSLIDCLSTERGRGPPDLG